MKSIKIAPAMITYRPITTADREYVAEKLLRNRVLRAPLGLALSEADVRGEERQFISSPWMSAAAWWAAC